jgi:hypothetical protein
MAIINYTPHDIHIYDAVAVTFMPAQRKYNHGQKTPVIPAKKIPIYLTTFSVAC